MPSKNLSVLLSQSKELYVCGVIQLHENDDPETYHWRKVEAPDVQFVSADAGFTDHIAAVDHDGSIWIGGSDYTEEYPQRNKIHFQKRYEEVFFLTVVCGSNFTLAIDSENRFWGGGSNTRGNLGHTDCRTYSFWYNPHSPPLRSVCAGKEHGYAVNTNCILEGFGGSDKCYRPVSDWASYCYDIQPLATPTKIIRVVAGNVHGLALDENDSVWGFGTSKWGQLGVVSTEPQEHIPPLLIKGLPEVVVDVWAGGRCSYFQDEDSQVWVCGDNSRGQLGIKNDEGKSIVCPPMRSPMLEGYELYPGSKHLICVSGDCTVYGLGDNRYGQLGITKEIQETRDLIPVGLNLSNSNKVKSARSSSMLE